MQNLSFIPRSHCFSGARVAWRNIVLNAAVARQNPVVDLSEQNVTLLLHDLLGPMSFIELCELYRASQLHPPLQETINWPQLFACQNRQWTERIREIFLKLAQAPTPFLDWAHQRQMSGQDLMPINALKNPQDFFCMTEKFSEQNPTRNEGKKIIDLLVDLLLLKTPLQDLLPESKGQWLQKLYQMRNPQTVTQDQQAKADHQWPAFAQVQRARQGDRLVQKMQFHYTDERDLNRKLQRLQQKASQ